MIYKMIISCTNQPYVYALPTVAAALVVAAAAVGFYCYCLLG